jgi:hypothetical protein
MAGIHTAQFWTYVIAAGDTFLITSPQYNFTTISILASGGAVSFAGNGSSNGNVSQNVTLSDGQSVTLDAGQGNSIEYLFINASLGDAMIVAR